MSAAQHSCLSFVIKERKDDPAAIVACLLKLGADPNQVNALGQTPLFYCVTLNQVNICKLLLKNKNTILDL